MAEPSVFAYRAFVAVANHRHFTRAAETLHMTVPALSQQVRRLEDQLGVELFIRSSRHVELSDGGRELLPLAKETLYAHDRIQQWAKQRNEPVLRIGFVHVGAPSWVGQVLAQVPQRRPGLRLELRHLERDAIREALHKGEVDAVFVWGPEPPGGVKSRIVAFEDRVAALNINEVSARFGDGRREASLADLAEIQFIVPASSDVEYIDWCLVDPRPAGGQARRGPEAQNLEEIFAMIAAGLGGHIVPMPVASFLTHEAVSYVRLLDAPPAPFRVCVADRAETPLTSWFLELVSDMYEFERKQRPQYSA